jgi:CBS domain-containing protein
VGLVMQRTVPTIAASAPLPDALTRLLATPDRFLVVLDAGLPIGMLTDQQFVRTLGEPLRSAWLAALRNPDTWKGAPEAPLAETIAQTAGGLADTALPSIDIQATQDEAIRVMIEGGYERLVVLDEERRLAGLLARRGLLRALAQSSAG